MALEALFNENTGLNHAVQLRIVLNLKIHATAFSHKSASWGIVEPDSIAGDGYVKKHCFTHTDPLCANSGAGLR
jgi:hypothetical protein